MEVFEGHEHDEQDEEVEQNIGWPASQRKPEERPVWLGPSHVAHRHVDDRRNFNRLWHL